MIRFYGFSDQEIMSMDCRDFYSYYNSIDTLSARESFNELIVANYTATSDKSYRNKVWKETKNRAFPPERQTVSSELEIQAFFKSVQGR